MSLLPLYLLNLEGVAPPPAPPIRLLSLSARVENDLVLSARAENALALSAKIENALSLTASITVSSLPQSLSCVYGEAVTITVTMDTPPVGGVSGWTLGFWIKKAQGQLPPSPVVTKTSGSGIATTDATNGVFTITLSTTDTKQTPGTFQFDFWRTDSGQETALAQGKFSIGDTTRP
jgi:hypothetical protein